MVVIVAGVVMLAALNRFSAASAQANGREFVPGWQYKIAYNASEKQLNDLGSQGWELSADDCAEPGEPVPRYVHL